MHALAFRVMRLCKPSLQVDSQTRLDLALDVLSDADAVAALSSGKLPDRPTGRTNLSNSLEEPRSLEAFGGPHAMHTSRGHSIHYWHCVS